MSLVQIEAVRDKHLMLIQMFKKLDYMINKHTNYEVMGNVYEMLISNCKNGYISKSYESYYKNDLLMSQRQDKVTLSVLADIKGLTKGTEMYAFITIGWRKLECDEGHHNISSVVQCSQNVMGLKYFKTCYMVIEKFRENGIHHHTHFLVTFEEKYPLSKILGWIYQTSGVAKACEGKNFIDYLGPQHKSKPFQPYQLYHDYVHGIKKESKMVHVIKDREWRKENSIKDIYEKL